MKATLDIPDELYRRVKARSALEGRSLRSVAIELFQNWLQGRGDTPDPPDPEASPEELLKYPWLPIARKYAKPGISADLADLHESIALGWAVETAGDADPEAGGH